MLRSTLVALFLATAAAGAPEIQHGGIGCVVADQFPRLEARIVPADTVVSARVRFRPEKGKHWYSVPMKAEGEVFAGVLPKPRATLAAFTYYIEATRTDVATARTTEFTPRVAAGPAACKDQEIAGSVASAAVKLEVPAGAPAIPSGFSGTGVTASAAGAAAAGTAVAAGSAGVAAAGGGVSAGMIAAIGGGAAAVAGAVVAVGAVSGGDGGDGGGGPNNTQYDVEFTPNIDVGICRSGVQWCCQDVQADQNGNFDETWAPNEPNTARVQGSVTATSFSATLSCTNGAASTALNASGSGGTYRGTFSFNGSNGTLTVTRR